ncbi:AAA family ATPase [Candidatus Paracaedibacter symbiosus]|uniref:AAA family ATPase n=1 Tax=Candidatus Paracaedibacter symbiosus TaxID=244582 RepID=UPI00050994D4|nr:AAA family ATPase [Candidatus Paracaedibacter symbiosus]
MKPQLRYLLTSLFFIPYSALSNDTVSPYIDVFDESIYDQRRLEQKYRGSWDNIKHLNEETIDKKILELFIDQKISCLENKMFPRFKNEFETLKRSIEAAKPTKTTAVLGIIGRALSQGTSLVLLGTTEATKAAAKFAVGASLLGTGVLSIQDFWDPDSKKLDFQKVWDTLENKKKELIRNIVKENISDLEFTYVLRKRFYPAELRSKIEGSLLGARNPGPFPPLSSIRVFLENCLDFPIQKKVIEFNSDFWNLNADSSNSTALTHNLRSYHNLCSYNEETKEEFKKLISQLIASSQDTVETQNTADTESKRAFYFFGGPGVGKTTAAEEILNHLGLPFFVTPIRSGRDISQSSLEGQGYSSQNSNLGYIVQALLRGCKEREQDEIKRFEISSDKAFKHTSNVQYVFYVKIKKVRETYSNTIIILNDFDRLLLDPGTATQTLAMLLDYLDPKKATFFSPYFDRYVPIKDLIFIITANNEIPKPELSKNSIVPILDLMQTLVKDDQSTQDDRSTQDDQSIINRKKVCIYKELAKLELKGNGLQNKTEAKERAKQYLEDAEKLGDEEATGLLNAMKFLDKHFPSLTDYKETIETNSDPFKALRDRVIENKCTGLGDDAKNATLKRFMDGMLEKYKLDISEDEEISILEQTAKTQSIRNAKTIIENEILQKRIRIRIGLETKGKEKEATSSNNPQGLASNDTQNSPNNSPSPMEIEEYHKELVNQNLPNLEMDKDLQNKIGTLYKIAGELNSLGSASEEEQINAINNLLGGEKYVLKFIPMHKIVYMPFIDYSPYAPLIESLYKTESIPVLDRSKLVKESTADNNNPTTNNSNVNENALGAFKNRMNRFDTDQKKAKVFMYHLELVKSIAIKLLKLEKVEQPYKQITKNANQKEKILSFCYHLEVLKEQGETTLNAIDKNSRHYTSCKNAYNEFVSWFTNKGAPVTCSDVIKSYFNLSEQPTPSAADASKKEETNSSAKEKKTEEKEGHCETVQ